MHLLLFIYGQNKDVELIFKFIMLIHFYFSDMQIYGTFIQSYSINVQTLTLRVPRRAHTQSEQPRIISFSQVTVTDCAASRWRSTQSVLETAQPDIRLGLQVGRQKHMHLLGVDHSVLSDDVVIEQPPPSSWFGS